MRHFKLLSIIFLTVLTVFFVYSRSRQAIYCSPDGILSSKKSIQSHRSYCIKSEKQDIYSPNAPANYSFSIVDDEGNTVKDFETVHERIMHVIIVRSDLAEFQHVHPDYNPSSGRFTLNNLVFPSDGPYRIFADFTPRSEGLTLGVTLFEDIKVGDLGKYKAQEVLSSSRDKNFGGYNIKLAVLPELMVGMETKLRYIISKNGQSVTDLDNYLGALGHAVMLHDGDIQFVHAHPEYKALQDGAIDFMVHPTMGGMYKVFMQFMHEGKLVTTDFVLTAMGEGSMDHSEH